MVSPVMQQYLQLHKWFQTGQQFYIINESQKEEEDGQLIKRQCDNTTYTKMPSTKKKWEINIEQMEEFTTQFSQWQIWFLL